MGTVGPLCSLPNTSAPFLSCWWNPDSLWASMCLLPGDGSWLVQAIRIILPSYFQASVAVGRGHVSWFWSMRQEGGSWRKRTSAADANLSCFASLRVTASNWNLMKPQEVWSQRDDREEGLKESVSFTLLAHKVLQTSDPWIFGYSRSPPYLTLGCVIKRNNFYTPAVNPIIEAEKGCLASREKARLPGKIAPQEMNDYLVF